jgi:hypothetical protein
MILRMFAPGPPSPELPASPEKTFQIRQQAYVIGSSSALTSVNLSRSRCFSSIGLRFVIIGGTPHRKCLMSALRPIAGIRPRVQNAMMDEQRWDEKLKRLALLCLLALSACATSAAPTDSVISALDAKLKCQPGEDVEQIPGTSGMKEAHWRCARAKPPRL